MKLASPIKVFAFVFIGGILTACNTTPEEPQEEPQAKVQAATDTGISTSGIGDSANLVSEAGASDSKSASESAALATETFYFEFDQTLIRLAAYESLKAHAAYLAENPTAKARLEGHADERGTREYNVALGERRGKAVSKFLMSNGANASQLEVISYGEERSVVDGHDESSWSQNRRVALKYVSGHP